MYRYYILLVLLFIQNVSPQVNEYWDLADQELEEALSKHANRKVATNIILFVGDGMSFSTITAARIYKGQKQGNYGEEEKLEFEKFPYTGLSKTYTVDKQIPDSAGTATAMFTGVKTNYRTLGLSTDAQFNDCSTADNTTWLSGILKWAEEENKDTGFVTTTRVTHATPAALYAHSPNRFWECDAIIDSNNHLCKDIARQLVEDSPGKNLKVIMGGGLQMFEPNDPVGTHTVSRPSLCERRDGRNLISDWEQHKAEMNKQYAVVRNAGDLELLDTSYTDYVLGLFSYGHMPYELDRVVGTPESGPPTLANMVKVAIEILEKNNHGYFLMVEGGLIDSAHHDNEAKNALEETLEFDKAVLQALSSVDIDKTLMIVTADHGQVLTMAGSPDKGNNILEFGGYSDIDLLPYLTLSYVNGRGFLNTYEVGGNNAVTRKDLREIYTEIFGDNYRQTAAVPKFKSSHGGEDVPIYARGPGAHLFCGVHEQNYIAHAMSSAAHIGPQKNRGTSN